MTVTSVLQHLGFTRVLFCTILSISSGVLFLSLSEKWFSLAFTLAHALNLLNWQMSAGPMFFYIHLYFLCANPIVQISDFCFCSSSCMFRSLVNLFGQLCNRLIKGLLYLWVHHLKIDLSLPNQLQDCTLKWSDSSSLNQTGDPDLCLASQWQAAHCGTFVCRFPEGIHFSTKQQQQLLIRFWERLLGNMQE